VERPGRKVRFARLIHRRVRAFWPAFGRRRPRRRSEPALVATDGAAVWTPWCRSPSIRRWATDADTSVSNW